MLQFFEWFWNAIGLYEKLGIAKEIVVDGTTLQVSFQGFMNWLHGDLLEKGESLSAALIFSAGILICTIIPYLLGSLNAAIIVSKYKYHDDIRKYGSGNAGMTNMGRVFGKQGALLTLVGDMLKQFVAVLAESWAPILQACSVCWVTSPRCSTISAAVRACSPLLP